MIPYINKATLNVGVCVSNNNNYYRGMNTLVQPIKASNIPKCNSFVNKRVPFTLLYCEKYLMKLQNL